MNPVGLTKYNTMKKKKQGGRPVKTATEKRTYRLNLKMSTEEYYTLKARAQEVKETLSEYARQILANGYIRQRITPEMLDLIRKLSGMANNLNQIARKANAAGFRDTRSEYLHLAGKIDNLLNNF